VNAFHRARETKEFLISRIVAEAQRENIRLSEVERKMLHDWVVVRPEPHPAVKHFLFYLRDETFECDGETTEPLIALPAQE